MNSKPPLSSFLHFLVELALILAVAAAFGLLIFHSASSPVTGIE